MKKIISILLVFMMIFFTACSNEKPKQNEEGNVTTNNATDENKTDENKTDDSKEPENSFEGPKIARRFDSVRATFNPHIDKTDSLIYGSLIALVAKKDGSNIEFVPYHAEEIPKSEDGKLWNIKIREGLTWTDGTSIDAHTYEYSFKMQLDSKLASPKAGVLFDNVVILNSKKYFKGECKWEDVGIKATDDYTLQIILEKPSADIDFFLSVCKTYPVLEKMYEANMNADRSSTLYGTTSELTPSCGPYRLSEWVPDQYTLFDKNENDVMASYYPADQINSRIINQNAVRMQLFENNELDFVPVGGSDYDKYINDPSIKRNKASTIWGMFVNEESKTNPILADLNFRKALYYGVPREKIVSGVYKTFKAVGYFVPEACYAGNPLDGGVLYRDTEDAKKVMEGYGTDEKLAKEYFDKAYEKNGNEKITVELVYFDGQDDMKRLAEVAQEEYERIFGSDKFNLKLRSVPPQVCYEMYKSGEYEIGVGTRPISAFNPWMGFNCWTSDFVDKYDTFKNEEFDKLQEETTTGDLVLKPEERIKALAKMEKMLLDDLPFIPMFQNDNLIIYNERINLVTEKFLPGVGFASNQADIVAP